MVDNPEPEPEEGLLTLDEVCERVDMSVRNVRFYTTRGLVPPPIKRGRQGFYDQTHVARLQLVSELQGHGFTLAAIERYVARVPADATPEAIALHRTLLAPWTAEHPERMTKTQLDERAGRTLSDRELEVLLALDALVAHEDGIYEVTVGHLESCFKLIEFNYPLEAAVAARDVFTEHVTAMAESLNEIFHQHVWPAYRASGASPEDLRQAVEAIKPITTAALVTAYEKAVTEALRGRIARLVLEAPDTPADRAAEG